MAVKQGLEFQINTYTNSDQQGSAVATLDNGNFVVTWHSTNQDGSTWGVYGQIFSDNGAKQGSEFRVNTYTNDNQSQPSISSLSNGNFVVTWHSNLQDGSGFGIYGQVFNWNGVKQGTEFQVNTYTADVQAWPAISSLGNGNFVVTWYSNNQDGSSYGTYGQIFTGNGDKQGSEFQVNTYTGNMQLWPRVTALDNGNFVIIWQSYLQDGSDWGVYGQVFHCSNGIKRGTEFQVNTYTAGDQSQVRVAALDNGNFVVVWYSNLQDGSGFGIYGQVFNGSGVKQGTEFQVNTYTSDDQAQPDVSTLGNGNFIVTWTSSGQDNSGNGIYGQVFSGNGVKQDAEFLVNTRTTNDQQYPAIASFSNGNAVITWESNGQDGSGWGVYGQVFSTGLPATTPKPTAAPTPTSWPALAIKQGSEFLVNTYTSDRQVDPSVATLDNGNFIVTWHSYNQDGSGWGVYGQVFTVDWVRQGTEFRVNTYTNGDQVWPSVSSLGNGNFVVVWYSSQDGSGYGVYGQVFGNNSIKQGTEFLVNTYTNSDQFGPSVSSLGYGNFVVVWHSPQDGNSWGVYGQIFTGNGDKQGSEFLINTYTVDNQSSPNVATLDNGNFVVVWKSYAQDGSSDGVYGQVFHGSNGVKRGTEFQISTYTIGEQSFAKVAALDNGNFVVVWHSNLQDGSSWGVYGQVFTGNGIKQGTEFQVNTYTTDEQSWPEVSTLGNGNFIVTWISSGQDNSGWGVYGQVFSGNGVKQGMEFLVNTWTTNDQQGQGPTVTSFSNGNFVVTWHSNYQDGSSWGVYGQMFSTGLTAVTLKPTELPTPAPGPALAIKQGSEFQVNTYTNDNQSWPRITALDNGNFIVTWISNNQDGSSWGVYSQVFSSDGVKQGSEFLVSTYTLNDQYWPAVSSLGDGNFVITWRSPQDGNSYGIYGQVFTGNGVKQGTEFRVNTYTLNSQDLPSVSSLGNGSFVIIWISQNQDGSNNGIYGQIFTGNGDKQGSEFMVNTYTRDEQSWPRVATLDNGNFVVTWQSWNQDGSNQGVYGQAFRSSNGARQGAEFQINTYTTGEQSQAGVAALDGGKFVVVWHSSLQDGSGYGVYCQVFSGNGIKQGTEFLVNTYTTDDQSAPDVSHLGNDNFIVAWTSSGQDNSGNGVYGQVFSGNGTKQGTEFLINTRTTNDQQQPVITSFSNGNFVVAWHSNYQDGSSWGVFGQIFSTGLTFSPTLSPTTGPTTSNPTLVPTFVPTTNSPTFSPTLSPTAVPTTRNPTVMPTTGSPTFTPTGSPTSVPTTSSPTDAPTTSGPTTQPTLSPTSMPTTSDPTLVPTESPTHVPTTSSTTSSPTLLPTSVPTTSTPTITPTTSSPTLPPTLSPTAAPTYALTANSPTPEPTTTSFLKIGVPILSGVAAILSAAYTINNCKRQGMFCFKEKTINANSIIDRSDEVELDPLHAPIGISLSNKKIDLISLSTSNISFDYHDNGNKTKTSWVGPKDAFLIYDHNVNRQVDAAKELVLTKWSATAITDFEVLKEIFDSNKDNKFDAKDAEFNKFMVWQDKSQDGVSQYNELSSLLEAGLLQIDFNTEQIVHGEFFGAQQDMKIAEVLWKNGYQTIAYDLMLAVS